MAVAGARTGNEHLGLNTICTRPSLFLHDGVVFTVVFRVVSKAATNRRSEPGPPEGCARAKRVGFRRVGLRTPRAVDIPPRAFRGLLSQNAIKKVKKDQSWA